MIKIGKFVSQVKTEMQKVSWPSRDELISSTIVVLISTILMAVYIGVCDLFLSRFVNVLIRGVF
ncbi:MAG: preprotein translocase subunit SecE [Candidatus Omnitrophota bacterium]|jgi:preprotein translocase subunit SecE